MATEPFYEYLMDDPAAPSLYPPNTPANMSFAGWATAQQPMRWWAPAAIRPIVRDAWGVWLDRTDNPNAVTFLRDFVEFTSDQTQANVQFYNRRPGGCGIACVFALDSTRFAYDSQRGAWYWYYTEVSINLDYAGWASYDDQVAILSHEIGHLWGLDERYTLTDPLSCSDEATIMDGTYVREDGLFAACTPPVLQAVDAVRVKSYWAIGSAANRKLAPTHLKSPKIKTLVNSDIELSWKDGAYTDYSHAARLEWANPATGQTEVLSLTQVFADVGLNRVQTVRVAAEFLTGKGVVLGDALRVCVYAEFLLTQRPGKERCSFPIAWGTSN